MDKFLQCKKLLKRRKTSNSRISSHIYGLPMNMVNDSKNYSIVYGLPTFYNKKKTHSHRKMKINN